MRLSRNDLYRISNSLYYFIDRSFPKTSAFGKATLDLEEKQALDRFFQSLSRNQPGFGKA
jgi:hypothetical protein